MYAHTNQIQISARYVQKLEAYAQISNGLRTRAAVHGTRAQDGYLSCPLHLSISGRSRNRILNSSCHQAPPIDATQNHVEGSLHWLSHIFTPTQH